MLKLVLHTAKEVLGKPVWALNVLGAHKLVLSVRWDAVSHNLLRLVRERHHNRHKKPAKQHRPHGHRQGQARKPESNKKKRKSEGVRELS